MKTGALTSMTSGLSVVSISVLLVVSFSLEASAKRGCTAFGHSCFGGHGKRSDPDVQKPSREADPVSLKDESWDSSSSNDVMGLALSSGEIQVLQDFVECRIRAMESSRRPRVQPNYMPLLIGKWLASSRRPYNAYSQTNDK